MGKVYVTLLLAWCCGLSGHATSTASTSSGLQEFCLQEGFEVACAEGEVMVMTSAMYGRMRLGRCVVRDYGFVGCGTDVIHVMTSECSGRQSCHISNMEGLFTGELDCPNDLKPYLEVSWDCIPVITQATQECQYGFAPVEGSSGYLSSQTVVSDGPGTTNCPWLIKVQIGRKVNVTLVDFSLLARGPGSGGTSGSRPRYCREYAQLREPRRVRSIVVCDGDEVDKHTYISEGNVVEVMLERPEASQAGFRFLLKYEAIGCAMPELPTNMRGELTGISLHVRCNFTQDSWTLTCQGEHWTGRLGNCSTAVYTTVPHTPGFLPLGVTVLIILGVSIVICVITLGVGLAHIKSRQRRHPEDDAAHKEDPLLYGHASSMDVKCDTLPARFATIDRTKHYATTGSARVRATMGAGDYAHIWEVRRPVPVATPVPAKLPGEHSCENCQAQGQCLQEPPQGATLPKDGATALRLDKNRALFTTFKPKHDDHIYQSPLFERRFDPRHPDLPFYFELDPNGVPRDRVGIHKHSPQCAAKDIELRRKSNAS